MLTVCALLTLSATHVPLDVEQADPVQSPAAAGESHVLILAKTKGQKNFIKDAARFAVKTGMVPVTLDELNAMIEAERVKDLMGCDDVTCLAEISGAYGIRFVLQVRVNPKGNRAMLTLHDTGSKGKRVARQIVSHESAVDSLLADFDQFRSRRNRMRNILHEVPCSYPWRQLQTVLGTPHDTEAIHSLAHIYRYYDLEITVDLGQVRYITTDASGISASTILSCL